MCHQIYMFALPWLFETYFRRNATNSDPAGGTTRKEALGARWLLWHLQYLPGGQRKLCVGETLRVICLLEDLILFTSAPPVLTEQHSVVNLVYLSIIIHSFYLLFFPFSHSREYSAFLKWLMVAMLLWPGVLLDFSILFWEKYLSPMGLVEYMSLKVCMDRTWTWVTLQGCSQSECSYTVGFLLPPNYRMKMRKWAKCFILKSLWKNSIPIYT